MPAPQTAPAWANELALAYESRASSQFILFGNVHDRLAVGEKLVSLADFLEDTLLKRFGVVLSYDMGTGLVIERGGEIVAKWQGAELQQQIRTSEERLVNYAKNNQIISLDPNQNTVVERLAGLNRQLLEAENDRKTAEAAYNSARTPEAATALADDGAKQNNEIEGKLIELRQKRALLLVDATEEAPEVKEVNEQITELVRDNETLDAGIDAWESELHRITGEIRKAKRQKAKNEGQAEKLRAKRQIVAEAAFRAAAIDQP